MKYLLIGRVLAGSRNIKDKIYSIVQFLLLFIITSFIVTSNIYPSVKQRDFLGPFLYGNYDVSISDCSEYTYNKFANDPNVDGILSSTIQMSVGKAIKGNKIVYGNSIMPIYGESLDVLDDILITDKLYVKKDKKLLNEKDAIIISLDFATTLGASLGDRIEIEDLGVFVVAGIFETSITWATAMGVSYFALYDGVIKETLEKNVEYMRDSKPRGDIYIRYKDIALGRQFVEENFIWDLTLASQYGVDYHENLEKLNIDLTRYKGLGLWRQEMLDKRLADKIDVLSPPKILKQVGFGALCLLILFGHENTRRINSKIKEIAILSVSGLAKRNIYFSLFVRNFVKQCILIGLSILFFTEVIALRIAGGLYVPSNLIQKFIPLYILVAIITSILPAIYVSLKISSKELLKSLNATEVMVNE